MTCPSTTAIALFALVGGFLLGYVFARWRK